MFGVEERRSWSGIHIWRNDVRYTGLVKWQMGFFCIERHDSMAAGDGSTSLFQSVYIGGYDPGVDTGEKWGERSICTGDWGDSCDLNWDLMGITKPGAVDGDAWIQTVDPSVNELTSKAWWLVSKSLNCDRRVKTSTTMLAKCNHLTKDRLSVQSAPMIDASNNGTRALAERFRGSKLGY